MRLKLTGGDQNPCKNYLELSGAFKKSLSVENFLGKKTLFDVLLEGDHLHLLGGFNPSNTSWRVGSCLG